MEARRPPSESTRIANQEFLLKRFHDIEKGNQVLFESFSDDDAIIAEHLVLDENGNYAQRPSPCFFEPLELRAYPIDTEHAETMKDIANVTAAWENKSLTRHPRSDAVNVCTDVEGNFGSYKRTAAGQEQHRGLRQLTGWIHGGINADDDLKPGLFYSSDWSPQHRYRRPSATGPHLPHSMMTVAHGYSASEDLLRGELLVIAAAMIMGLRNPSFLDHATIPVMVFSFIGKKARILQAHDSPQGLVIRKTKLYDFLLLGDSREKH